MFGDLVSQFKVRFVPRLRPIWSSHWTGFLIMNLVVILINACQEPSNKTLSGDDYTHPGLPSDRGGMTLPPAAVMKSEVKEISMTEDTVLDFSGIRVTIPVGAVPAQSKVSLVSHVGAFVSTPSMTLDGEPILLVITGADGNDLPRTELRKDIRIEMMSSKKARRSRVVVLFHENSGSADAVKTGMSQSMIAPGIEARPEGGLKASFLARPTRMAMVLALTSSALPMDYEEFIRTPVEVTELSATGVSPISVDLTWKSDPSRNKGFALKYEISSSISDFCTEENRIEPKFDPITQIYSYTVTGLEEDVEHAFKLCAISYRDPGDFSEGTSVSVKTLPKIPLAILSNTPPSPTNAAALNVTVSGEWLVSYRYALLSDASDCSAATYSSLIDINTPITESLSGAGAKLLCVLGWIHEDRVQEVPTSFAFTFDPT